METREGTYPVGKAKLNSLPDDAEVGAYYTRQAVVHKNHYLSYAQERALAADINDAAIRLYNYYTDMLCRISHAKAGKRQLITDTDAADQLGWDESKVARMRKALQKYGWFHFEIYRNAAGVKGVNYYLGKDEVTKYHEMVQRNSSNQALKKLARKIK